MKKNILLWFFILSFIIFILDNFGFLANPKVWIEEMIMPIKRSVYLTSVVIKDMIILTYRYPDIFGKFERYERLKIENEELDFKLKLLQEENSILRKQLEAPLPSSYKYIPAKVIGISRYLEVAVGEKDGVKPGMIVVDGTTLIGKITSTSTLRSNVMLPTDFEIVIPAITSRGTEGMIVGRGESIIMEKVLQKDPLFLEDLVITSGKGDFPPNLIIGKISYINADDVSVYKWAKISPNIDYSREKIVFILSSQ